MSTPQATSLQQDCRGLSPDRIRQAAISCLRGLQHLHRQGLCLRDIKLENLLVRSPGGQVELADFGHATPTDSSGRLADQWWTGTLLYKAPEVSPPSSRRPARQLQRNGGGRLPAAGGGKGAKAHVLTSKVDIYALGVSLRLCAGWNSRWQTALPAELQAFIDCLMEPLPAKRPTAGRALQHAFLRQEP